MMNSQAQEKQHKLNSEIVMLIIEMLYIFFFRLYTCSCSLRNILLFAQLFIKLLITIVIFQRGKWIFSSQKRTIAVKKFYSNFKVL